MLDLLNQTEECARIWPDGELLVEPVPVTSTAIAESTEKMSKEVELLITALRRAYGAECERLGPGT